MGATHTASCKWCSKKYQKGNNALIFIKLGSDFCSKKCESAYNAAHGDNSSNGGGNDSGLSKEEKKQIKLENEIRENELRKIREEEQKIKDRELADKTMKFYNLVKPYLKFIIPIYVVAFVITFFLVKEKNRMITGIFFGLPLTYIIYLAYNAFSNRTK